MQNILPLEWFVSSGLGAICNNEPFNFMKEVIPEKKTNIKIPVSEIKEPEKFSSSSLSENIAKAYMLADKCSNLEELRAAVEDFDDCLLKKTANKTVFADGNPNSNLMLIGEAPGADEDIQGIPFCGASGQLLDKVLWSIKLNRQQGFYITNTIFWRPPGNRKPTPEELAVCEPFLQKHIALVNPKMLLLVGATAVNAVLKNNESMNKLRGKIFSYTNKFMQKNVPVIVTYHPSFLLRSPLNKRLAWEDMLFLKASLNIT